MGGERTTTFSVAVAGDDSDIRGFLSGLRSQFASTVASIEATAGKIKLFEGLEERTRAAADAMQKATATAAKLAEQLETVKKTGGKASDDLVIGLKSAQQEVAKTTAEYNRSVDALSKLQGTLTRAGVDTRNLANEQTRLAEAARQAAAAMVEQNAKAALGLKTLKDIQPQINQLNAAFLSLRDGGKLSFGELSTAQAKLQQQVAALRAETGGLGQAFADIRGRAIAFVAAIAGITAGVVSSAANFRAFAQEVAAVDSIADAAKTKIDQLAAGVRDLARTMGVDAVQSAKALYEIISSGIPANNALTVLEQATKASIAGITDVATAAKVGVAVLNGYGLEVTQLGHVYDVLFQTVKDGVISFPELAKNIGQVIPAARAAKIPLEELGAAFVVLTRVGIDAPEAATAINSAIIHLSAPAPEAAQRLRDLGIEVNGLTGTIEQLAARKLTLGQLAEIIPDVRAQRAVFSLINNFQLLRDELGEMNAAAGQTQAAYLKLADTPQAQVNRFNAAVKDLSISLGEFVTGSGGLVTSLTGIVNSFNALAPATKTGILQFAAVAAGGAAIVVVAKQLAIPLNLAAGALFNVGAGGVAAAAGLTAAKVAMVGLQAAGAGFLGFELGKQLYANFASLRVLGDIIGTSAAAVVNLAEFAFAKLKAALTGNAEASAAASAAFKFNREIIAEQWVAAITGASERLRALDGDQKRLIDNLAKTSQAAGAAGAELGQVISRIAAAVQAELNGVDQIIVLLQGRLQSLNASLVEVVQQIQTNAASQLANLDVATQQSLAGLALLQEKELANANATIDIQRKAAAERLTVLKAFAADAINAFDAEAAARVEIAKRTEGNVAKVEQDLALARKALLQGIVDAYRAHYAGLLAQQQAHLDKIKAIEGDRLKVAADINGKIREIERQRLGVGEQYADRIKEIEQTISLARQALLKGDLRGAEDYANKVISLSDNVGKEVKDDQRVVVDAYTAQKNQVDILRIAQETLFGVLDKRAEAERDGAEATKTAAAAAKTQLDALTKQLADVNELAAKGMEIKITADVNAVNDTIRQLDERIEKRDRLIPINADITKAQVEVKRLTDELEQGVTVNAAARIASITAALADAVKEKPELNLDVSKAIDAVEKVQQAVEKIGTIQIQLESNAKEVQAEIDNLKKATSSTHTIYVTTVPTSAAGGFIGGTTSAETPVQTFAGGGAVFRKPSWSKVPGTGDGDTVPALLNSGSFVVRKAASQYYGDGLMQRIVRGYADGGSVFDISPFLSRFFGANSAQALRSLGSGAPSEDQTKRHRLKVEAEQLLFSLAEMGVGLPAPSFGYPLASYLIDVLDVIRASNSSSDIEALLNAVKERADSYRNAFTLAHQFHVGAVLGINSAPIDLHGKASAAFEAAAARLARGGSVGDVVPALLTPGEFVINQPTASALAKMFGGGFLPDLNAMRIPPGFLDGMMNLAPPPRPLAFATGGMVPGGPTYSVASGTRGAGPNFTINIYPQSLSADDVKRHVVPAIDKLMRRSK